VKVTLLVPTLNEYESMTQIMPLVEASWVDQILVVDGGSTDKTVEWSRSRGYEVYVQKERGLRAAYREALPLIRGDVVITFSPDGNSVADRIPALVDKMREGFDMVIVSRYLPPARSQDDSWVTGFGNWFFTKLTNLLHGASYTDAFVMFRAYKTRLFDELNILKDEDYSFAERLFRTKIPIEPLLSVRAAKARLRLGEIPGDEPARIGGERKLQVIRWGAGFFYQIVSEAILPSKFAIPLELRGAVATEESHD
jgi:glycosyltransferase involved in cell wall biosynthesis